jgi:hypothetical protein
MMLYSSFLDVYQLFGEIYLLQVHGSHYESCLSQTQVTAYDTTVHRSGVDPCGV